MPLIEVTAPQGSLNKARQTELMSRLSNAVLTAEGASLEHAGAQSLVWAHFNELPRTAIFVGGKNPEQAPLRVAVTTPAGALNENTRQSLIGEIGDIVDDLLGPFADRLNHWVMLYELDDGSWGGAGTVFHLSDIQAAMNIRAA